VKSVWRAELLKFATVRGQWISAILVILAIPVISFLVVATGGLDSGQTSTSGAATGALAGLLAFGVWSATIAAGEYAQGTMVTSLMTVPRRSILYVAKLTATAATTAVGAILSAVIALLVVLGVRAPGSYGLGNPAALFGVVIALITVAVIGVSVGLITRSPSASIAIVVVALLLPKAASGLLGGLQPWIIGASPGTVVTEIVGGTHLPANQTFPAGTWAAALTMLGVAAVVAIVGAITFFRRDG
jgi:ABC-2 type transport system permease protein